MNLLQNVLIYSGPGTCKLSVGQTLRSLKQFLSHAYDVKLIDLNTLANANISWDTNCALFVMPGGRDCYYDSNFREHFMAERIKRAIQERKMKYLGICAGAYFAADCIEFEMGRLGYEISGERPLQLVDCVAKGTLFPGLFKYSEEETENETSFRIVDIEKANGESLKSLYIGGCYFETAPSSTIAATYTNFEGKAAILANDSCVLSGIHLEYDAIDCLNLVKPVEKTVMSALIQFEPQRKRLLHDLLSGLGLNVKMPVEECSIENFTIYSTLTTIKSFENIYFEQMSRAGPFDYTEFQRQLPSAIENLTFLYAPIITSTQTVLLEHPQLVEQLPDFSVFMADHQVRGRGRGKNSWISSPACLQFTLLLKTNCSFVLPMIQYLMAIAVTETANSLLHSSSFRALIKWPNDVYLCSSSSDVLGKLSGILVQAVNSLSSPKIQHVFVGTGVNVASDPNLKNVIHLNDFVQDSVTKETFLAECLGRFNLVYREFLSTGKFPFAAYYKNWLHFNQKVSFEGQQVTIKGIDDAGYLQVQSYSGSLLHLEPDGNSFDMMNNLLKRK